MKIIIKYYDNIHSTGAFLIDGTSEREYMERANFKAEIAI